MNLRGNGFGGSPMVSEGGHSFLTIGEYRSKSLGVIKPHEDLEPLHNEHHLRRLLENPNPFDTFFDLMYERTMFEELTGVSFLWAVPNQWGVPCELWVLPSHWVWPRAGGSAVVVPTWTDRSGIMEGHQYVPPDNPYADKLIQYYEIRPWGGMGSSGFLRLPPDEIIMSRWKSPLNKVDGWSKLTAIAQWIDEEESISKSRWAQSQNIARPEFMVEVGPGYEDPDDDRIARVEAKIINKLGGELNYGRPFILPPGAKVTPLSFSPAEMAYFECLSDDTECLTSNGWKKYTELTKETKIACYDDKSKEMIVFLNPSAIHVSDYSGPMMRWNNEKVDILMTPNHRAYLQKSSHTNSSDRSYTINPYEFKRADSLEDKTYYGTGYLETKNFPDEHILQLITLTTQHRSVEEYSGKVWCVTVPTGLFVVRRNGKAHITGNSETQIRDMISAAFRYPIAALGISENATYGSILAVLASLSSNCLNPRLTKSGQSLTKDLAKRWDEDDTSAWSNGVSYEPYQPANERLRDSDNITYREPAGINSGPAGLLTGPDALDDSAIAPYDPARGVYISGTVPRDGEYSERPSSSNVGRIPGAGGSERTEEDQVNVDWARTGGTGGTGGPSQLVERPRGDTRRVHANSPFGGEGLRPVNERSNLSPDEEARESTRRTGKNSIIPSSLSKSNGPGIFKAGGPSFRELLNQAEYQVVTIKAPFNPYPSSFPVSSLPVQSPPGNYSTAGYGGRGVSRRVRIWWDDTTPADPAQVNADLQTDSSFYAVTPDEVRAIRGRKGYDRLGVYPIVQGPAGPMPFPLGKIDEQTIKNMEELGKAVAAYSQAATPQQQGAGGGMPGMEDNLVAGSKVMGGEQPEEGTREQAGSMTTEPVDMSPGIANPNSPPSKSWKVTLDDKGDLVSASYGPKT